LPPWHYLSHCPWVSCHWHSVALTHSSWWCPLCVSCPWCWCWFHFTLLLLLFFFVRMCYCFDLFFRRLCLHAHAAFFQIHISWNSMRHRSGIRSATEGTWKWGLQ
jgi:hypothetical protein